ncbi:hypothetical protein ACFLY9_02145 [Patescibacteria group bacterium]
MSISLQPAHMDTEETSNFSKRTKLVFWIGIPLIILVAIIMRALIQFETELMPGVMSSYYPIQVRSILENGNLGLPDLPFVFYLEALVAKAFILLNLCNESTCIMNASKWVDAIIYPMIVIPFFFLIKLITKGLKSSKWIKLLIPTLVSVSIPGLVMMADFQKNSIGLMWTSFYIYFLYKASKEGSFLNYLAAGIFFSLTGLSHLGGIGLALAFTFLYIILLTLFKHKQRKKLLLILLSSLFSIIIVGAAIAVLDRERFDRLVGIILSPFQLFKNPMLVGIFTGEVPPLPHLMINAIYSYIICALGIILFIRKRQIITGVNRALLLTSILTAIFLSFPLLDDEWATRLYLMAYIPASIVLIFILGFIVANRKRNIIGIFTILLLIVPLPIMWQFRRQMCLTEESFNDLYNLKEIITEPDKSVIIARHGLEWWASWVLETDISHGRDITEEIRENYEHVYFLVQITGHGDFGQFGPGGGPSFPEPEIPSFAETVYEDSFYKLAKVNFDLYDPSYYNDYSESNTDEPPNDGNFPEPEAEDFEPFLAISPIDISRVTSVFYFGETLSSGVQNPTFEYYVDNPDVSVSAVTSGVIVIIEKNTDIEDYVVMDYEISIKPTYDSRWLLVYDHVIPEEYLELDMKVNVGDILGKVGDGNRTELQVNEIFKSSSLAHCPLNFASEEFTNDHKIFSQTWCHTETVVP